ncbi:MAG: carboxylating nicotinate-nucleotide diphosphorylase [Rhodospirillales bacterium]|nr:carboxylating nicotinate-nucleotide diphosphorylase [Rhodospirillales bacterium]MDP7215676.1 carboxylating nicotinate-nucleotide diphosphorylase [Rhodospirillales bacterium]HIJ44522.1 carboxylating nicotinate-nucleotide diphosphorylase [Rhodospirillaceae bacterium]HIJ93206.1 carboxylating nicotinate-nucleotide diphosphorylase [Rhodospirillaceae bacterium]HJP53326.1 carboxylating nicotinate-nucleotide diphosphorylase [Rhodospirillales bacterium]
MTSPRSGTALDADAVSRFIDRALAEDLGRGDITSNAVIPENAVVKLVMTTRQDIVVAGIGIAALVFLRLASKARVTVEAPDGTGAKAATVLARLEGPARGLLSAERTALNIVQHLSGIATLTRAYAERIAGSPAVLMDTRKTVPGLRKLAKYATAIGGARNHRLALDDGVLIKDNHIAVAGSLGEAVKRAKAKGLQSIEVECDSLGQVEEALAAGAGRLLLDNMDLATLRRAVELTGGRAELEASGGVTLESVRAIAETGVDFISAGRITSSAPAADIGLDSTAE